MRFAGLCFVGFGVLVILAIAAALTWNPSRHDPLFLGQLVAFVGGIALGAICAAWQLWTKRGCSVGYGLVGILTLIIVGGWSQYGKLQLEGEIHPVLYWLRTVLGLYVLLLWAALFRASFRREQPSL